MLVLDFLEMLANLAKTGYKILMFLLIYKSHFVLYVTYQVLIKIRLLPIYFKILTDIKMIKMQSINLTSNNNYYKV
jgi:hypothetical protein